MNSLGKVFQVSMFGESHGELMGVTLSGIAPGICIDLDYIYNNLSLRRPKRQSETSRQEPDDFKIVSGYFNGYTTGAPLTIIVKNKDVESSSYDPMKDKFRPSHADYGAYKHALGFNDYRGGGIHSGRLTVLLVIAGSIALQILDGMNIKIATHIYKTKDFKDVRFSNDVASQIKRLEENDLPIIDHTLNENLLASLRQTQSLKDSSGAILETIITNVEAGIGEPSFNKLDSVLSAYLMNIPAIKGVSFGTGFNYADFYGSEVIDEYYLDNHKIKTSSNHNGGIVGGLSTGMPILINTVVKPTSSLPRKVRTINRDLETTTLQINGRHDSSIFTRMPIIINSLCALALVDLYSMRYGYMVQRSDEI